jgi:hypothetical protein
VYKARIMRGEDPVGAGDARFQQLSGFRVLRATTGRVQAGRLRRLPDRHLHTGRELTGDTEGDAVRDRDVEARTGDHG